MANTPKATDGETPKKRTRKTASAPEDNIKVTDPVTKAAAKSAKPKDVTVVAASPAVPELKPEVTAEAKNGVKNNVKSEVFTMQSAEERVRLRAYELYLRRGGRGGSPEQDWFQAMQEIYGESVA